VETLSHTCFDDRPLERFTQASSADRFWSGFDATINDVTGGYTETRFHLHHKLTMLVGAPLRTTCRCDDATSTRFQARGAFDVIPAGYGGAWVDEGASTFLTVNVSQTLVRDAAEGMGLDPDRVAIVPHLHARDPQIEHIGWALAAELRSGEPFGRLYADSLGVALAAHLLRRYAPSVAPRGPRGLSKRQLRQVTDYIGDHIAHDLSLPELASVADMSTSHLKSLFKLSVGVPVHQYVIRRRAEYAIDLLANSVLPLSDVALAAGFANQSHMARCIRRLTGLTPGALRNGA